MPSRRKCLWLASSLEEIAFWKEKLGFQHGEYQVLKFECEGKLHKTHEGHLTHGFAPMDQNIKHAKNYWSGVDDGSNEEILFDGLAKVVEILE